MFDLSHSARTLGQAVVVAAVLGGPAFAQAPVPAPHAGTNIDAAGGAGDLGPVGQLDLAQRLFDVGRESHDPLLVIAAARLALNVPVTNGDRKPEEQHPGPKPATTEGTGPDRDGMVAVARQMAMSSGDPALTAMAQGLSAPVARGRVAGAARDTDWLTTNHKFTYPRISFEGGEHAEISLRGGDHARLNLYVYDQNGNLICLSRTAGSNQYCSWYPSWTGPFRVVVENVGSYDTEYEMVTN